MRLTIHTQHPNYQETTPDAKAFAERWLVDSLSAALMIALPNASIRVEVGWFWGYEECVTVEDAADLMAEAQVRVLVVLTLRNVLVDWMRYVVRNDAKTPGGYELFGQDRLLLERRLMEPR